MCKIVSYITNINSSNEVEPRQAPRSCRSNFGLFFKQKGDDSKDEGENPGILSSIWKGIKRFVPDVTKAKIEKSYEVPQTEGGYRYHIRLVGSNGTILLHVSFMLLLSISTLSLLQSIIGVM